MATIRPMGYIILKLLILLITHSSTHSLLALLLTLLFCSTVFLSPKSSNVFLSGCCETQCSAPHIVSIAPCVKRQNDSDISTNLIKH